MMTNLTARVTVPEQVLFRDLKGEAVLLDLESGNYYGLNETGTRMWSLLVKHGHVEPAFRILAEEYDIPSEQLQEELWGFVRTLTSKNLLVLYES
jgi:hypothetical protein